jgi:hypothetical protein
MRKSFFGLVVAGATLAGAIGSASPAGAINVVYNGNTYDVTTISGTWDSVESQLTSNAFWGNNSLASGLAGVVTNSLGLPNENFYTGDGSSAGPLFAFERYSVGAQPVAGYWWDSTNSAQYIEADSTLNQSNFTYATATAVPWETDALPVIGSTILFVGGLWAKNKFAKPLQK